MDEFQQFGWAKYIPGQILFLAKHHPKAVGYALFFDLAHLVGWNARSMLIIGRMQTALLGCATLGIIYATARTIGESRLRALAIVLMLLSFSNFMERIFETRAEPPALFFAAAALLVAVRGGGGKTRVIFIAGVLSGLAFLTTQKSLYFNVALGLALVADAAVQRRWINAVKRGAWLVLGWSLPVAGYCLIFGWADPLAVAENLLFGPTALLSPRIAAEYGGLRQYVVQTLTRNLLLYQFCFAGMLMAALRITKLDGQTRIALIFTWIITILVFRHDQPWPYVFIIALPFMVLWSLRPLDWLAGRKHYLLAGEAVLVIAIGASFVRNIQVLRIDNHKQLELVDRAEALLTPSDVYFDGMAMLPDRFEPSTLWLDRHTILVTMTEGRRSEAYRIFSNAPPKTILWSYRMDGIDPLVEPLIHDSYVQIAPNLRIAGQRVGAGQPTRFDVPTGGQYALYDSAGMPVQTVLLVDGKPARSTADLCRGPHTIALPNGAHSALLLPRGEYVGRIVAGPDDQALFANVYD